MQLSPSNESNLLEGKNMELSLIKEFCIREIKGLETRNPLLDIFYILLKANGKSYMRSRTARIKNNSQQLNLFRKT